MNREQIKLMEKQGEEKLSLFYRTMFDDGVSAKKYRAEGCIDRVEGLRKLWKEWYPDKLSYHDEATFIQKFSVALRDMRVHAGESPEPGPEYDEMISCFLPRKQRQELKDKGLNQQQITEVAKEQILTSEWIYETGVEKIRSSAEFQRFVGVYNCFPKEMQEIQLRDEQKHYHRQKPGKLEEFIAKKQKEYSLEDYIRVVGNRRFARREIVEYEEEIQNAQKEAARKAERASEPKVEKKKEPVSLKSVFNKVKGFVKQITMSAEEEARIAAEEKRAAAEKAKVNKLKTMIGNSYAVGKPTKEILNESGYRIGFDSLGNVASSIDPEAKTITLNSAMSEHAQALSLINAACVLKHEKNGAAKSPEIKAVRQADAFAAQMVFAAHQEWYVDLLKEKNPEWVDMFYKAEEQESARDYLEKEEYIDQPSSVIYKHTLSSFVDACLDKMIPADKKPSPEQIANVCRTPDGESYYTPDNWYSKEGRKEMTAGLSAQTEIKKPSGIYKEQVTPAMIAKAKQNGR